MPKASPKWRRVTAYVIGVLVAAIFIMQGVLKLDPDGFWTGSFERWGYPVWFRYVIGVVEIGGGLMLLVPKVVTYGAGGLGVVMIGAAVTRLRDGSIGDVFWIGVYLLLLGWFAYEWRGNRWRMGHAAGKTDSE